MFCEKCGAKISKDAEYCSHCGAHVSTESAEEIEKKLESIAKDEISRKSFVVFFVFLALVCLAVFITMDYYDLLPIGITDFLK